MAGRYPDSSKSERSLSKVYSDWLAEIERDVLKVEEIEKKIAQSPLDFFSLDSAGSDNQWTLRRISDATGDFTWSFEHTVSHDEIWPSNAIAELGDKQFQFVGIAITRWSVLVAIKVIPLLGRTEQCPKLVYRSSPTRSLIRLNFGGSCIPCNGGNVDDPLVRPDGEFRCISFPPLREPVKKFQITFGKLGEQASWTFDSESLSKAIQKELEEKSLSQQLRDGLESKFAEMTSECDLRIEQLGKNVQELESQLAELEGNESLPKNTSDGKWPF